MVARHVNARLAQHRRAPFRAGLRCAQLTRRPGLRHATVDTFTGGYFHSRRDLGLSQRAYSSRYPRIGGLGPAWTHNYQMRLTRPPDAPGDVGLSGPWGRTDRFVRLPDDSFQTQQPLVESLTRLPDTSYVAEVDGQRLTFSAGGVLTSIEQPGLDNLTVQQGRFGPERVLDSAGHTVLSFVYDGDRMSPRLAGR